MTIVLCAILVVVSFLTGFVCTTLYNIYLVLLEIRDM